MKLYLVSKKLQESSSIGVIQAAETVVYGIFSDESRANYISSKYGADVASFYTDAETRSIIQRWVNPGYAD